MSQLDYGKLVVIINNYVKLDEGILVTFLCRFLEEETLISSPAIPIVDKKKSEYYLHQAFKATKKDIKQWVKDVSIKPSVIGSQYVFSLDELWTN